MKKFLVGMMAVITAVILVACSNASNKDLVHVGVLQYVEHPSLSATRKGFIEELKEEGYVDGKNISVSSFISNAVTYLSVACDNVGLLSKSSSI